MKHARWWFFISYRSIRWRLNPLLYPRYTRYQIYPTFNFFLKTGKDFDMLGIGSFWVSLTLKPLYCEAFDFHPNFNPSLAFWSTLSAPKDQGQKIQMVLYGTVFKIFFLMFRTLLYETVLYGTVLYVHRFSFSFGILISEKVLHEVKKNNETNFIYKNHWLKFFPCTQSVEWYEKQFSRKEFYCKQGRI